MKINSPRLFLAFAAAFLMAKASVRGDELVSPDEMAAKGQWFQETLLSLDKPVVSFLYNGVPSGELLPGWKRSPITSETLPDGRIQHLLKWTDPLTGLEVRVVALDYADYPAVEWTAYVKNTGASATPLIEQVRGLDTSFRGAPGGEGLLVKDHPGRQFLRQQL